MRDKFVIEPQGEPDDRDRDTRHLDKWLKEDLANERTTRMNGPGDGELGGTADAVIVLAGTGKLSRALCNWLSERSRSRRISVRISATHKEEVLDIDVQGREEVQALRSRIMRMLDED
ncbi:hypothetical protein JNUCC0626_05735 [Lentzea sp. JNUCC 0626]|uniref:effector-associated constant component EACC1 n=1 Tax=Lentzea sp. JNUCC 0626 TaxID=3367513 RepID=UPI0037479AD0